MESLALLVTIIMAPAMFGGPLALVLTTFRKERISPARRYSVYILSLISILVGFYLLILSISRGATIIGLIGILSGFVAIFRFRMNRK